MRKLYQTQWHGIHFNSFTKMSSIELAGASFYASFYKTFFEKYRNSNELDPSWIKLKNQTKEFLKQHKKMRKESNILSIGCGLGLIEKALIEQGYLGLEVTEVAEEPLKWLYSHISPDNMHVGFFPDCLPCQRLYDFIYLAGVECFFKQEELIRFLKDVRERLLPTGTCLIVSWSFEPKALNKRVITYIKEVVKHFLDKTGIKKRGQFWGYIRNRKEFYEAMSLAGFAQIKDGFLEKKTRWNTYWIEAYKS